MQILVIGREGQLARSLALAAQRRPQVSCAFVGRDEADLANADALVSVFARHGPDLVINAGAYTAVDPAEAEPERALAINAVGPRHLAGLCASRGIPMIHISTDYVFDGALARPYREDDPTGPIGSYGRSKLAGERAVANVLDQHIILRTAWLYSPWGRNFVRTMLSLGASRGEVRVVSDQLGSPTYAPHLAEVCLDIAERISADERAVDLWGVYHCAGAGEATWWHLACEIFRQAEAFGARPVRVTPVASSEYPTATARPANSRLDCGKLKSVFGLGLPAWDIAVKTCVQTIMQGSQANLGAAQT